MEPNIQASTTERRAIDAVRSLFQDTGWTVKEETTADRSEDLVLTNPHGRAYHVVLKAFAEGRSDRVTPSFAQALLEARLRAKSEQLNPAVAIWVGTVTPHLVKRLVDFHRQYGGGEPLAVLSPHGVHHSDFPGVEADVKVAKKLSLHNLHAAPPRFVFSDMNQWLLKLLLVPDIRREGLIAAPLARYNTATELARAAGCSINTATRFVNALKTEGFLESSPFLSLTRRSTLVERWKAEYKKSAVALQMKFLGPMSDEQLTKLLTKQGGILGLFAAAKALGVGHVRGVPPTVWVHDLSEVAGWRSLRLAREGEGPDLIIQQPDYPQSLSRGAVTREGIRVTDIIQTWLDVSSHPARGAEQAAELEHGILANLIKEGA